MCQGNGNEGGQRIAAGPGAQHASDTAGPMVGIRDAAGDDTDLLVSDPVRGRALAALFDRHDVVPMRGHGSTVAAPSLRRAVYRAVMHGPEPERGRPALGVVVPPRARGARGLGAADRRRRVSGWLFRRQARAA